MKYHRHVKKLLSPLARLLVVAAAILSFACGDDGFDPTVANVTGAYTATTLTSTNGSVVTDQLAAGSSLTITLSADGTTTGRLFFPFTGSGGSLDVSLAGTWTLNRNTVEFTHTADSFLRDMTFTASRDALEGQATFGGSVVRVVLTK